MTTTPTPALTPPAAPGRQIRFPRRKASRLLVQTLLRLNEDPDEALRHFFNQMPLTPQTIIRAYSCGFFPIPAEDGRILWHDPEERALVPIADFKTWRDTRNLVRYGDYEIRLNTAFRDVIEKCAAAERKHDRNWITPPIIEAYSALHELGAAHSFEVWQDGQLVAGTYGVALGAYFAGESTFHTVDNMGKVSMYYACQSLKESGFLLHDAQYMNPGMAAIGAYMVSRADFKQQLAKALATPTPLKLATTVPPK
jgi:leucyl/phenylalanyl-tRNA--protein transferase